MRKAFTLLELVFVIIVIGILAVVILPSTKTNVTGEAATKFVTDLRYAKHLGIIDDVYTKNNASWYKNRWTLHINNNKYSITSGSKYAQDPLNREDIKDVDTHVTFTLTGNGCNGASYISFDTQGRPYIGNPASYTSSISNIMKDTCTITLSDAGSEDVVLTLYPETGYIKWM